MAEVFVSYKAERKRAAEHLKRIVEAHGFSVWYAQVGLVSGSIPDESSTFRKQIERELRAAGVVLVLWDADSRESDWVEDEARLAKRLGTYVPVRIGPGVDPPLGLGGDHLVDLGAWDGAPGSHLLYPLFREIERRVGRAAVVRRPDLERIDQDWRLYGSPRMVTFEQAPSLGAQETLPLDWQERPKGRPFDRDITVRLIEPQPIRKSARTLRPEPQRQRTRWIVWALVAAVAAATIGLVLAGGALHL